MKHSLDQPDRLGWRGVHVYWGSVLSKQLSWNAVFNISIDFSCVHILSDLPLYYFELSHHQVSGWIQWIVKQRFCNLRSVLNTGSLVRMRFYQPRLNTCEELCGLFFSMHLKTKLNLFHSVWSAFRFYGRFSGLMERLVWGVCSCMCLLFSFYWIYTDFCLCYCSNPTAWGWGDSFFFLF